MTNKLLSARTLRNLSLISLTTLALSSCETTESTPAQPYDDGVIVVNEGNFFSNNGTLSLMGRDSKTATTDIFFKENNRSLSGGVAGYTEADEKGIILVDNSTAGKDAIEIVNARTFKSIATIKDEIENPRRAVRVGDNKVYVTCWGTNSDFSYKTGYIAVIDLTANKVTKKINLNDGCESIIVVGNNAYVGTNSFITNPANKQKNIKVIDTTKDELTATIEVGENPGSFLLDASNKIWMIVGKEILLFNPINRMIETRINAGALDKNPSSLTINANKTILYYNYNSEIYSLNISDKVGKSFIKRRFSNVGVDANSGQIYTSLIPSYVQAGYIFRYQSTGTLIDSVKVEIAPSGFYFK